MREFKIPSQNILPRHSYPSHLPFPRSNAQTASQALEYPPVRRTATSTRRSFPQDYNPTHPLGSSTRYLFSPSRRQIADHPRRQATPCTPLSGSIPQGHIDTSLAPSPQFDSSPSLYHAKTLRPHYIPIQYPAQATDRCHACRPGATRSESILIIASIRDYLSTGSLSPPVDPERWATNRAGATMPTNLNPTIVAFSITAREIHALADVGTTAESHIGGLTRSLVEIIQDLEILYLDRQEYLDASELKRSISEFSSELGCILRQITKVFDSNGIRWDQVDEIREGLSRITLEIGRFYRRLLASSDASAELRARQASTRYGVTVKNMDVPDLKRTMREAVMSLAAYRPLFRNPAVEALLPRNFERLESDPRFGTISGLADYIKTWEGRPSLRTDSFFLYSREDGSLSQVRDKPPIMMSLTINAQDHTITGNCDEDGRRYAMQGQRVGLRVIFTTGASENFETVFTPWGLVGHWQSRSNVARKGPFYMWIADGPQADNIVGFARLIL